MKKKLFALLALVMTAMTASASAGYDLTVGTSEHGTIAFTVDGNARTYADEGETVTVTITPNTGWAVNEPSGQWYAAIAAAPRRTKGIDLLNAVTLTKVEGKDNQWTFTMARANVEISATYKKLLTHEDISIDDIEAVTYTGNPLTPSVTVKDGTTTLVKDQDYTVSYSNNVNAGTGTATITGTGLYDGQVVKDFTINRAKGTVIFSPYKFTKTFGDPDFTIEPEVNGVGLLRYSSNRESVATVNSKTGQVTIKGVGKVEITASLIGSDNYIGMSDWYEVTVEPKALEDAMVADIAEQNYTGEAVTPELVLTFNDMTLAEGTDYTVEYADNTDLGQATATITGTGNYTGAVTKNFTIAMAKLTLDETEDNTEALAEADGKWYDVTVKRTLKAGSWNTVTLPFSASGMAFAIQVAGMGITAVKELESSSLVDGVLTMNFKNATSLVAGKPYLVKVSADIANPTFTGVMVSKDIVPTVTDAVDFVPTLGATEVTGDTKEILFLAAGNKLLYPETLPADMKGFRAYFKLKGETADIRSFSMNLGDGETTSIKTTNFTNYTNSEELYDLQGRRVSSTAKKGVYIVNGKKVVIK